MAAQIQLRRDTAGNWTAANPILAQGEPGIELATNRIKIGDGVTAWNALPYKYESTVVESPAGTFTFTDELGNQTIWVIAAGGGENNTASNVGLGGVGLFKQKTGADLEFKNINAANNKISVTNDGPNNEVDIGLNEANVVHQNLSGAGTNTHAQIDSHIGSASNPHAVTITQAIAADGGTDITTSELQQLTSGGNADSLHSHASGGVTDHGALTGLADDDHIQYLNTTRHSAIGGNPHGVTKTDVGLGNVDNTSDVNKTVSTAQGAADSAVQAFSIQRANHTGTQLASTISDFAATVRSTVLTGLSLATSTAVTAADSVLVAIGKLQAQLNQRIFGTEYQYFQDTTPFVTTSGANVSAALFSAAFVSGNLYRVNMQYNFTINSIANSAFFGLYVNGTLISTEIQLEIKDSTDDPTHQIFARYTAPSTGNLNVELRTRMEGGSQVTVSVVKCDLWRVQ